VFHHFTQDPPPLKGVVSFDRYYSPFPKREGFIFILVAKRTRDYYNYIEWMLIQRMIVVQFRPISRQPRYMKISAECPHCQHSLMDEKNPIKGIPSISLQFQLPKEASGKKGIVHLSAYFGDNLNVTPFKVPEGIIGEFSCPFCGKSINNVHICELCGAPMVNLQLERGGMLEYCLEAFKRRLKEKPSEMAFKGMVQLCSRRGCKKQLIEFKSQEADLKEFYKAYSKFLE